MYKYICTYCKKEFENKRNDKRIISCEDCKKIKKNERNKSESYKAKRREKNKNRSESYKLKQREYQKKYRELNSNNILQKKKKSEYSKKYILEHPEKYSEKKEKDKIRNKDPEVANKKKARMDVYLKNEDVLIHKKEYDVEYHKNRKEKLKNTFRYCKVCNSKINKAYAKYCDDCLVLVKTKMAHPCKYVFKNKIICCASKLEYTCLKWFSINYNIINISRVDDGTIQIPYIINNINRIYNPDFKIITDSETYIVEVKSIITEFIMKSFPQYANEVPYKKNALIKYCNDNNFIFFWFDSNIDLTLYQRVCKEINND